MKKPTGQPEGHELRSKFCGPGWMSLRGATPQTRNAYCEECGRPMAITSQDEWFLKNGQLRVHVKCALKESQPLALRKHCYEGVNYLVPKYWNSVQAAGGSSSGEPCEISGRTVGRRSPIFWDINSGNYSRHVLREEARKAFERGGHRDAGADTNIERVRAEPVETPTKIWELKDPQFSFDPWATVGYGKEIEAGRRGIRLEIAEALSNGYHKGRAIVTGKLEPQAARRLGEALIEAADQADRGQTPATKRSDE